MKISDIGHIIENYGAAVYGFCRRLADNRDDADELYQQTFLKAVELRHRIDIDGNPKSFLISLAVGIWKNTVKKRARRARLAPEQPRGGYGDEQAAASLPDRAPGVEELVISGETRAALKLAIDGLSDDYRLPLLLFYNADMKISEIAALLKKPEGTVKRRLHEARQKIRKDLEGKGYV